MRRTAFILLAMSAGAARAAPLLSGSVSLTGLYYVEQERPPAGETQPVLASPAQLAMADLRLRLSALGLASDRLDIRLDARVRGTGDFNFDQKFQPDYAAAPATMVSAQGYLGGREYDLREANLTVWLSRRLGLQLGRMFVTEADALKVDALRLRLRLGDHWEVSIFGGGYPNPYSRSLFTDYSPPCADGVASGSGPCTSPGPQPSFAAGATARYQYSWIWGALGLVGSYFGPAEAPQVLPIMTTTVSNLAPDQPTRATQRFYLAWTDHLTPWRRLDIFSDLVVDFAPQDARIVELTRAMLAGHLRLLRDDRLTLRLAYSYMSSLGIDIYLSRMLYNRLPNGTTLGGAGVVENNLTILRTGRHEGRLNVDVRAARMLTLFAEGRVRQRALLGGETNVAVYGNPLAFNPNAGAGTSLAGDATVGLREGGSFRTLRGLLSYTFLRDFLATDHVLHAGIGGDPWRDRLSIDVEYLLLFTTDAGVGLTACTAALDPALGQPVNQLNVGGNFFAPDCYGRRQGMTHEAGLTLTLSPWRKLLLLLDYRFTIMQTSPQPASPTDPVQATEVSTVLGHSILLRAEMGL